MFRRLSTIVLFTILFITPLAMVSLPLSKNILISTVEFLAELSILIRVLMLILRSGKTGSIDSGLRFLCIAILCVLFSDTSYNLNIIIGIDKLVLINQFFYGGFLLFTLIFIVKNLNLSEKNPHEWIWIFLFVFIIYGYLSCRFITLPYFKTHITIAWKIDSALYSFLSITMFALIVPFAIRVQDRKTFWFFNLLILLLISDFAIRYYYNFVSTSSFPWPELGWSTVFTGLAYLIWTNRNNNYTFIMQPLIFSPIISIRSLLSLGICGTNILFVAGIFLFKLNILQNALDIVSLLLLLFIFWTIANEFSLWLVNNLGITVKKMIKINQQFISSGEVKSELGSVSTKNHIFEIANILEIYNNLVKQTNKMMNIVIDSNKKEAISEIASQVSHDIRSPLTALDMILNDVSELPEEKRILIRSSIGRIKDIANNLLQKKEPIISNADKSIQLLSSLIDVLVSEKRMQFRSRIDVEIDFKFDETAYGIFVDINAREFMRVVSNLINNAVESILEKGTVIITLTQADNYAILAIKDTGCGISQKLLSKLGRRGESYGKTNGHGLGLSHALKTVETLNGNLTIDSTVGIGTKVTIKLPLAKPAKWFVKQVEIIPDSKIVILDDDINIHQIWDERLKKLNFNSINVEVLHFSTPDQLTLWSKNASNHSSSTLFLIDYELIGFNNSGLDLIENLHINSQSILITSHYNQAEVRKRCEDLSVKLLPKSMAVYVPICIQANSDLDAILIDDDEIIHMCWQMHAKLNNKNILVFSSLDDFLESAAGLSKFTKIYLDVSLGPDTRGDVSVKEIFDLGFKNIYLCTGHDPAEFTTNPYIMGVIDKTPPF